MPWLLQSLPGWGSQKALGTVGMVICLLCGRTGLVATGRAPRAGWDSKLKPPSRALDLSLALPSQSHPDSPKIEGLFCTQYA